MLNIVTVGYRYENLKTVYDSIPKDIDVRWLVGISKTRPLMDYYNFIKDDARVLVIEADCEEICDDAHAKIVASFNKIKSGQFIILDDDTLFHENMLAVYRRYQDFEGLISGQQLHANGLIRLGASIPEVCKVDTGNCIAHHSVLKYVTWKSTRLESCPDGVFWADCYKVFGEDRTVLIDEPISWYNKLRLSCDTEPLMDKQRGSKLMNCGLVIIETREIPDIRDVVLNHIEFTKWPVTFFHGNENEEQVKNELSGLDVRFINSGIALFDMQEYNRLLTSTWFWNEISYDKVLIFHHDSRLLRHGIKEFLSWDYVGAPWIFQEHGGNGGLSIRSKSAMLRVFGQSPYIPQYGNEDVYFCNAMHVNPDYNLAPRTVCEKFACETIFKLGTLGLHAIDRYLTKEQVEEIIYQYS